jgi:signal transduction histidine kinase
MLFKPSAARADSDMQDMRTTGKQPRTARRASLGGARERAIFVAEASRALASSLDYEQTLQTVARLAIPRFADWAAVHLRQPDGIVRCTAAAHRDRACERILKDWYAAHPFRDDAHEVIPLVLRTGRTAFHPAITKRQLAAWATEGDSREHLERIGIASIISVPLAVEGEAFGALTFVRGRGRTRFGQMDGVLAEDLGRRAAVAITQARLHQALAGAQEALRAEQERTTFALQAAQVGAWEVDSATGAIRATRSMAEVHGLTCDRFPKNLREYVSCLHPDERDAFAAGLEHVAARRIPAGHPFDRQFRIVWPTGSVRWIEVKGQFIGRELIRGIVMDVTARRDLEQRVQQAQRLEAVGRLASGLAHDFTNVLSAIMGYTEVMLARTVDGDEMRGDLLEIQTAAERAVHLTRQLLGFGRERPWQPKPSNLNAVVSDLASLLSRLVGVNIELRTALDPNIDPVRIDPSHFEQVVMNLAINARDAMPDGGLLTIATARRESPRGDRSVVLSIRDTGAGMDEETRERIFEPFFTTKGEKGTGLGLSVVYGIVQQSAGEIAVTSAPGRGTTFEIRLPAALMRDGDRAEWSEPLA